MALSFASSSSRQLYRFPHSLAVLQSNSAQTSTKRRKYATKSAKVANSQPEDTAYSSDEIANMPFADNMSAEDRKKAMVSMDRMRRMKDPPNIRAHSQPVFARYWPELPTPRPEPIRGSIPVVKYWRAGWLKSRNTNSQLITHYLKPSFGNDWRDIFKQDMTRLYRQLNDVLSRSSPNATESLHTLTSGEFLTQFEKRRRLLHKDRNWNTTWSILPQPNTKRNDLVESLVWRINPRNWFVRWRLARPGTAAKTQLDPDIQVDIMAMFTTPDHNEPGSSLVQANVRFRSKQSLTITNREGQVLHNDPGSDICEYFVVQRAFSSTQPGQWIVIRQLFEPDAETEKLEYEKKRQQIRAKRTGFFRWLNNWTVIPGGPIPGPDFI